MGMVVGRGESKHTMQNSQRTNKKLKIIMENMPTLIHRCMCMYVSVCMSICACVVLESERLNQGLML